MEEQFGRARHRLAGKAAEIGRGSWRAWGWRLPGARTREGGGLVIGWEGGRSDNVHV